MGAVRKSPVNNEDEHKENKINWSIEKHEICTISIDEGRSPEKYLVLVQFLNHKIIAFMHLR